MMAKSLRHKKRLSTKSIKKRTPKLRRVRRPTRKMRGGTCYGTGVGSNTYDPNFSIYNTNMLKIFPYRA